MNSRKARLTVAFLVFSPPIANAFSSKSGSIERFIGTVSFYTHCITHTLLQSCIIKPDASFPPGPQSLRIERQLRVSGFTLSKKS